MILQRSFFTKNNGAAVMICKGHYKLQRSAIGLAGAMIV
jgi:hypothetical protein